MSSKIDPLELMASSFDRQRSVLGTAYNPAACGAIGFCFALVMNWAMRKPVFSGIFKHIGLTAAGIGAGVYFEGKRDIHLAKRDAIFRDYIQLHPEDFPPIDRKKFSEVFDRWVPIR